MVNENIKLGFTAKKMVRFFIIEHVYTVSFVINC